MVVARGGDDDACWTMLLRMMMMMRVGTCWLLMLVAVDG